MNLLHTDLGPFDALAVVCDSQAYEHLMDSTNIREVGELRIRVLELGKIIESKEFANRDKDRAVLPVLRKTLELKQR